MREAFVQEQVNKICKKYKIERGVAEKLLEEEISKSSALLELLENADSLKNVYKTRVFKDFIKKVRKSVYFSLRTYQKDGADLAASHISTKERVEYGDAFFSQIDEFLRASNSVIDLGGGMFPAMFPFEKYKNIKNYIWLDKDEKSFEKLQKFSGTESLHLLHEKIGGRTWQEILPEGEVDLALMLKLVPVVARQENYLLPYLAEIPAKSILVTGSKEAMVRKENIEARENKVIHDFIAMTGKNVVKRIDIENEFGYLIS